ncbi:thyroid hormone receptor beta-like [Mya arenaria]|uniref:thyroid hormone receptor beta-like n=1 Tax=Mya arenaria TaxID=6604 RepID=UPI0022E18208|nr:thyroid hormone receptor beta-like [Mya arenaria]
MLPLGTFGVPQRSHQMTSFASVSSLAQPMHPLPVIIPTFGQPSYTHPAVISVTSSNHSISPSVQSHIVNAGDVYTQDSGSLESSGSSSGTEGIISPPRDNNSGDGGSTSSRSSDDSHPGNSNEAKDAAKDRKRKGVPYIPSYMDLTNGPEPCVVCSDAATGYHYRCMTCEGCKGFFRRTIQKNLQYHCKWNKNCVIDKTTRNQCQECRFLKCLNVGMATDLVLNEKQRTAKRRLIEENRERRKEEQDVPKVRETSPSNDALTDQDRGLICEVVTAYEYTSGKIQNSSNKESLADVRSEIQPQDPIQLAEAMAPSIVKVVEFAKGVPGFTELNVDDQILLLKACCMEVMCLRAACRFDPDTDILYLHNGTKLHKSEINQRGVAVLIEPIFEFAMGLSKLKLDKAEIALLAAVLLMQSDRTGLKESENVEKIQDAILGAFKRYVSENRPHQPVHWAKILMKVTDLRTISTRHAERVLYSQLDNSGEIPPLLLEVFNEGHTS